MRSGVIIGHKYRQDVTYLTFYRSECESKATFKDTEPREPALYTIRHHSLHLPKLTSKNIILGY
jgi:hypothetical protein